MAKKRSSESEPQLVLTRHFVIQKGKDIALIQNHMQAFFSQKQLPLDIPKGTSVDEALQNIARRKEESGLPYKRELESEFERSLDWMRVQTGEADALRLIEKDWILVGSTIFFASKQPTYEETRGAVEQVLRQKDPRVKG